MATGISKEQLILQLRASGVTLTKAQLKKLDAQVKSTTASMGGMNKVMKGMAFMALGMTIAKVIKVGAEFQKSMANVRAIAIDSKLPMDVQNQLYEKLEKNARALGASTKYTASEVAGLQTEYAKLGFTASQIVKVSEGTLALASAVGADLAVAASTAGTTLRGFGMDVTETGRVTDVMALSFSKSALDMQKFTDSMKYVAPISKQVGVSLEGTTAILGQLANAGIDGSMAGTSLRKILLEAGNASSKLAIRMGGPITSFEDFQEKLKQLKLEGFDPIVDGADAVGVRAVTSFGILLDMADDTDAFKEALDGASGSAQDMADVQLDNLAGDVDKMKSAMSDLAIEIFNMVEGPLRDMVKSFTEWVGKIDANTIKSYATSFGLMAGSVGLYNAALWTAKLRTEALKLETTAMNLALARTPWGLLAIGVAFVGGEIIKATGYFEDETVVIDDTTDATEDLAAANKELLDSQKKLNDELSKIAALSTLDDAKEMVQTLKDNISANEKIIQHSEGRQKGLEAEMKATMQVWFAAKKHVKTLEEEGASQEKLSEAYAAQAKAKAEHEAAFQRYFKYSSEEAMEIDKIIEASEESIEVDEKRLKLAIKVVESMIAQGFQSESVLKKTAELNKELLQIEIDAGLLRDSETEAEIARSEHKITQWKKEATAKADTVLQAVKDAPGATPEDIEAAEKVHTSNMANINAVYNDIKAKHDEKSADKREKARIDELTGEELYKQNRIEALAAVEEAEAEAHSNRVERHGELMANAMEFIEQQAEYAQMTLDAMGGAVDAWQQKNDAEADIHRKKLDSDEAASLKALKNSDAYKLASTKNQKKMEDKLADENLATREAVEKKIANAEYKTKLASYYMAIGQSIIDTSLAIVKAIASLGPIAGPIMAGVVGAMGVVQTGFIIANKPVKPAQFGLNEVINTPTTLSVAEAGPELVQVTPLEEDMPFAGGGANINVTFTGNVTSDDFIELEAIPKIREAVLRGESLS